MWMNKLRCNIKTLEEEVMRIMLPYNVNAIYLDGVNNYYNRT